MKQEKIKKGVWGLLLVCLILTVVSLYGMYSGSALLSSFIPDHIKMVFITALSFLLSIGLIYLLLQSHLEDKARYLWSIQSIAIVLFFVHLTLLISVVFGVSLGLESILLTINSKPVRLLNPLFPSIMTSINFLILAAMGIMRSLAFDMCYKGGRVIVVTSAVAIIGHLFNIPWLYYNYNNLAFTGGMALNTAIIFSLLGMALILIGNFKGKEKKK